MATRTRSRGDEVPAEIDLSGAQRGRFYQKGMRIELPKTSGAEVSKALRAETGTRRRVKPADTNDDFAARLDALEGRIAALFSSQDAFVRDTQAQLKRAHSMLRQIQVRRASQQRTLSRRHRNRTRRRGEQKSNEGSGDTLA